MHVAFMSEKMTRTEKKDQICVEDREGQITDGYGVRAILAVPAFVTVLSLGIPSKTSTITNYQNSNKMLASLDYRSILIHT